ncbi:DUF6257 family protein [Streptomyces sp. PLK6-54]|uniref:DUF6257 family protein n=1 Tax=Actinacidiphila acidipaludis TaxID=2873382 RepID=A0ABS7QA70_9ACTN|nr:DUF6257 family protein [Streptomyces acidipaludis]
MRTHPNDPPLTGWEAAQLTALTARMAKRSLAGPDVDQRDLQNKLDRILDGARKRQEKAKK